MKKIFPVLLIFCVSLNFAFAQKSKVRAAANYYKEPYQEYDKAKAAIDEAILNDQSKGLTDTWYYRGLIYSALYNSDKYKNLCSGCLEIAYDAFKKSLEIDPKNEWADEIKSFRQPQLLNLIFTRGVSEFNEKKYKEALTTFEYVSLNNPGDTSVILNSAYSAERAGETQKAIQYYSQLTTLHYNDHNVYLALSNLYKHENDTAHALSVIRDGRTLFPDTLSLLLAEINILLASGKNSEVTSALETAIVKDPNNLDLYLALGSTYDKLANPKDAMGKELPHPANYKEYMAKSEQAYKRGLGINPSSYELNYNLGALYFNQAAELANAANNISSNTEYDKAKKEYEQKFRDAEPYLEKALELNPNDNNTLLSLKELYARTGEMEKYNATKLKLENQK